MNPALLFGALRLNQRRSGAAPAPAPQTVTPVMALRYVDGAGDRYTTPVVDGVTTITGMAPFFVEFFGYGSVSEHASSNTPQTAYWRMGFLMNFGENRGGTWPVSGQSRDTDRGQPVYAHTYETAGTYEARLTCWDAGGQLAYIRANVVVTSPVGAGTDMTSGVIPTFVSGGIYNAPAGGTWGNITSQLNGLHNVLIRKTGSGADPVFGTVNLDNRAEPNFPITRSRGIRFLDCDVADVTWGNVGFDSCSFTNGRVRQVSPAAMRNAGDEIFAQNRTLQQAQNVRYLRGLMLQNTGEMNDNNADGYVWIGEVRGMHIKGASLIKATTAQHNFRGILKESSLRHCLLNNTAASVSYLKIQGNDCTAGDNLPDPWEDDDMVVDYVSAGPATGRVLGVPTSFFPVVDCVLGAAGGTRPDANTGFGPENNVFGDPAQGIEFSGMEHCRWYEAANWYTIDLSGRYLGRLDCKLNMGAGGDVTFAAGTNHTNRTPDGYGEYFTDDERPAMP